MAPVTGIDPGATPRTSRSALVLRRPTSHGSVCRPAASMSALSDPVRLITLRKSPHSAIDCCSEPLAMAQKKVG